jgi:ornithine--oxo-acid transaminase
MDRALVHGSTFSKNDLAMAAGLATLEVIEAEKLVARAEVLGEGILNDFRVMRDKYELVKDVRGKGLMIGIEFGAPKSLTLKATWSMLEAASKGLFCQMVLIPLFKDHKILCQVSGPGVHIIKLLPALVIGDRDRAWIRNAFDSAIADCHRVPGAVWDLGRNLATHAIKSRAGRAA